MYSLREPIPGDAPMLAWLDQLSARLTDTHRMPGDRDAAPLADASRRVVVVEDRVAGVVALAHGPTGLVLADLRLLPAFPGRGLATALLKDLLRTAREAGVPFALHVPEGPHAVRLLERLASWGFVPAGETRNGWLVSLGRVARRVSEGRRVEWSASADQVA